MPTGLAHPEWAAAVTLLLTLSVVALIVAGIRARRRWRRLLGPAVFADGGARRSDALLLAALAAIGIALLGPQLGTTTLRVPASGVDLVLLVDVSLSMDARDVPPSRLSRAREAAAEVLRALAPGDQVALAAFAGRGVLLTPLTPDRGALLEMLAALDSALMLEQGSELASGIELALGAFDRGSARPRVLLVLSDGETPARSAEASVRKLRRANARVIAAAFGSERGAQIPLRGRPLHDALGETVVSRRETRELALLADASDGALFRADRWGVIENAALVAAIRRDARASGEGWVERRVAVTRFGPFAALALALLLLEAAPPARRRIAALGLLLCWIAVPGAGAESTETIEARLRARPDDAGALLQLGAARARSGDPQEARRAFLAAVVRADDDETASLAYYDLGVVALEQGDLEGARDAFFDAIALAPGDAMAKFNLEWTLRALELAPPLPPSGRAEPGATGSERAGQPSEEHSDAERDRENEGENARERARAAPAQGTPAAPAPLDAAQARHWIEAVRDDPGRALRSALGASGQETRRGPRW